MCRIRCTGHTIYYSGALYEAMKAGHNDTVMSFLQGFEVTEVADYEGVTLLHLAAACGNVPITKYLIKAGYVIDVVDNCGCTPLLFAVRMNRSKVVQLLINSGADVNFQDARGKTPMHRAVRNGDYEHVMLLLSHGADINVKDVEGGTAVRSIILCSKHPEILKLLMANGSNIHDVDKTGKMQCQYIFKYGNEQAVEILLNYGADMSVQDCFGDTPLHYVACNNDRDVIKVIYRCQLSVDERNLAGQTALHKAAEVGNLNCTKLLLEKGADPNGKDLIGRTPLYFAVTNNNRAWLEVRSDLIRYLFQCGARLSEPIANRHIVKFVVEQGIYPITFTVVEHIAKLDSLQISVTDIDRKAIETHSEIKDYYECCVEEIESMKTKTAFGRITYYNLLCDSVEKICAYARNESFTNCYKMVELLKHYPKHSRTLFNKCTMVYERFKFIENAAVFLSTIIPYTDPHHLAIRRIIYYLSADDLRRLAR
ncbi:PREDICTED: ankyrin repeat, PH and SEC7 domain containing protein secG-like [Ceratosolen solmsi marchali]|uniref:Ankyrin repeat, PH and SEC7 domain containing protein secG-like n=1 Tax=Ceratosolen solmsi marchali TaxID=326594 RepID=A0AAJ6YDI9_9HYME|nr:PREDICTED: ankyrin repeat, PH and SEC7 domain containing protein secG-like [Ceratosolen solmsi marchali]